MSIVVMHEHVHAQTTSANKSNTLVVVKHTNQSDAQVSKSYK